MGIFTKKTEKETKETTVTAEKAVVEIATPKISLHDVAASAVLREPRITEKATDTAERNVYVFNVAPSANKQMIMSAMKEVYKVTPVKVRVATVPRKSVFVKGKKGFSAGGKKAYVYLRKGDKIEII